MTTVKTELVASMGEMEKDLSADQVAMEARLVESIDELRAETKETKALLQKGRYGERSTGGSHAGAAAASEMGREVDGW